MRVLECDYVRMRECEKRHRQVFYMAEQVIYCMRIYECIFTYHIYISLTGRSFKGLLLSVKGDWEDIGPMVPPPAPHWFPQPGPTHWFPWISFLISFDFRFQSSLEFPVFNFPLNLNSKDFFTFIFVTFL